MSNEKQQEEVSVRDTLIAAHKRTLTNLDGFVKMMNNQLGNSVNVLEQSMRHLINNQGMELILQRQLEQGIRNQNLSTDEVSALLEELTDLRKHMDAEAKEAIAKAAAEREKQKQVG